MLIQLLYTSIPVADTAQTISEFIPVASEMNDKFGITGMIISSPTMFLQVIEGKRDHINQLYRNIFSDKRHKDCTLLRYSTIKHREFPNWSMINSSVNEIDQLYLNAIFSKGVFNVNTITGVQAMALLHIVSNDLNIKIT